MCAIILFALFLLAGMAGCKTIERSCDTDRTARVVERDTTILIQPDSATLVALLECDSTNNVLLRRADIVSGVRIQPTIHTDTIKVYNTNTKVLRLRMNCHEDSLKEIIHIQDSIISTTTKTIETQYIRRRNGYDKFVSVGFWVVLILLIGMIYIKIRTTKWN